MKNNRIQFWRIIFTYIIALYHLNNAYGNYKGWYIAVEFFFIVSGYLLVSKFERVSEQNRIGEYTALRYTLDCFKRYFPHSLFSFFVAFMGYGWLKQFGLWDYVSYFTDHLPEVFLIQTIGLNHGSSYACNSQTWYLSVLLILGYLIWFLLRKEKSIYTELIAPFSILLIYAYLYRVYGNLSEHRETVGFFLNSAMLRGFAAINVGILTFYLAKSLKRTWHVWYKIASDCCLLLAILASAQDYKSVYDFLYVPILAVGVAFAFADNHEYPYFNNVIVEKLAKISIAIYLNHKMFRAVFVNIFPHLNAVVYIIYLIVITVFSVLTYGIVYSVIPSIWGKIKARKNIQDRTRMGRDRYKND